MKKPMKKVLHNGEVYYSVSDAAHYLGTTTTKIRQMMGDGSLEWTQFRVNGRLFISAKSLVEKQRAMTALYPDKKPSAGV
jgi:excisionase family DNA binding protein